MKHIIKIHIEDNLDEDTVADINNATEEEINEELEYLKEIIKKDFEGFPEESIKQLDVYISKE